MNTRGHERCRPARTDDTGPSDCRVTGDGGTVDGTTTLSAGAARTDITPDTGRSFQGYVRPDMRAEGVGLRCFARALVLESRGTKVALVSADLLFGIDRDDVLERVASRGFSSETVLYVGTHTHASTAAGEWTAAQVAEAIERADANRVPAVAGWGTATVEGVNRNRSLEAHLANHGLDLSPGTGSTALDPAGVDHARETTLRLLRVETATGTPIAAWSQFPVHPTAFTPHNTVYSADLAGVAVRHFRSAFDGDPTAGFADDAGPLALFANGAQGDLIPTYEEWNEHALADRLGEELADGMVDAWDRAETTLSDSLALGGRARTVTYDGQRLDSGERVGSRALFGLPFFGGGENGPSFFYGLGLEGMRRPQFFADRVHGRKIPVAPAPWDPDIQVQVLRVGDRLLLGVPGEPTVQTGRRFCAAVAENAPDDISDVAVVGLANGYNGYFTTPEEYDQQHYEGGHTTFGKYSSGLLRETYLALARDLDTSDPGGTDPGGTGGQVLARPLGERDREPTTPTVDPSDATDGPATVPPTAPVGIASTGCLRAEPNGPVERFETVTVEWTGGTAGRDRPVGDPFVRLEREVADGWRTVETDLGLGFRWTVDGTRYTARYELPGGIEAGRYRLRVTGTGYVLSTDPFEVVPARTLRLLGVDVVDGGGQGTEPEDGDRTSEQTRQVRFRAQNPPPDPDRHLRARNRSPRGGTLTAEFDRTEYTADFDETLGGWAVTIDGIEPGDSLSVPAGGLVDGRGNTSGEARRLVLGDFDDPTWPAGIGPGGGRPPGPFGIGTWPW